MVVGQLYSSVACMAREVGRAEQPSLERDRGRENVGNERKDFASQTGVVVRAVVGCTLDQSCEGMESLFERGAAVGSRRSNQSLARGASFVVGCWLWEEEAAAAAVAVHMKPWNYMMSL